MIYIQLLMYFMLTCLIEGGIIALISKKKAYIYYSVLCNMLTNPALNVILILYVNIIGPEHYSVVVAVLEILVVGIEAIVYKMITRVSALKSIGLSLVCNVASFSLGLLL